jgi:hypothetical protein
MSYQPIATPPPPPAAPVPSPPPPPAPAAPRQEGVRIKPSKAWYWIGGLLIAAGVLTALGLFIGWAVSTSKAVDNFARVRVPPEGHEVALDFKKPGDYRIYYEWRSEADGQRVDNNDHDPPQNLQITMTGPNGEPINVQADDEDISFSFNDKLGQAVAKVDIPAPGTYTMQVQSDATEPFVIAVGKGGLQTIWPWWLLGIIGAFIVGVGLGLLAIIMTAVKRGRRKRELRRASQPPGGYGTPVGYQGADAPVPVLVPPPGPVPEWTPPPPTAAGWGAPGDPTPTETVPAETGADPFAPSPYEPTETVPAVAAPTETLSTETRPTDGAPTDAAPTDAAPTDAAPTEVVAPVPPFEPPAAPPSSSTPTPAPPAGNDDDPWGPPKG